MTGPQVIFSPVRLPFNVHMFEAENGARMPCGKTVALIFVQTINTSAADLRSLQAAIELSRSMKVDLHPPTFPDNFKSTIAECSHLPSSGVCAAFDSEAEVGFSQHTMTGKFLDAQSSTDYEKQLSQRFLFVGLPACMFACFYPSVVVGGNRVALKTRARTPTSLALREPRNRRPAAALTAGASHLH